MYVAFKDKHPISCICNFLSPEAIHKLITPKLNLVKFQLAVDFRNKVASSIYNYL